MIWESEMGLDLHSQAIEAVKRGCDSVIHNGKVYSVKVQTEEIGRINYKSDADKSPDRIDTR